MTTPPVAIERRVGQRFPYLLPLSLRQPGTSLEGVGFTQDLSSRGVFFFTDAPLTEGREIELTLRMPSEITLGENMPVRCRGRCLAGGPARRTSGPIAPERLVRKTKIGVAVRLEGYEYLPESSESSATFPRVSSPSPGHARRRTASGSLPPARSWARASGSARCVDGFLNPSHASPSAPRQNIFSTCPSWLTMFGTGAVGLGLSTYVHSPPRCLSGG